MKVGNACCEGLKRGFVEGRLHPLTLGVQLNQELDHSGGPIHLETGIFIGGDTLPYLEIFFCPWCGKKLEINNED